MQHVNSNSIDDVHHKQLQKALIVVRPPRTLAESPSEFSFPHVACC